MSLPTDAELKAYLKVTTSVEDELIEQINMSARAWVRAFYRVPLDSQSRTFTGLWPRMGDQRQANTRLVVPVKPCGGSGTLTDRDGATVDDATYGINERTGYIEANANAFFSNPPYALDIHVGWEEHPEFDDDVDPILRQAVLWAASTYYRNRNVAGVFEQSGGQVSITYTTDEIPPLLRSLMAGLKDNAWFA